MWGYTVRIRRAPLLLLPCGKKVKESQERVWKLKAAEAQDTTASLIPVSRVTPDWPTQGPVLVSGRWL